MMKVLLKQVLPALGLALFTPAAALALRVNAANSSQFVDVARIAKVRAVCYTPAGGKTEFGVVSRGIYRSAAAQIHRLNSEIAGWSAARRRNPGRVSAYNRRLRGLRAQRSALVKLRSACQTSSRPASGNNGGIPGGNGISSSGNGGVNGNGTSTPTPPAQTGGNTTPVPTAAPKTVPPPIPGLDLWRSQMTSWGKVHCNNLASPGLSQDEKLANTYYDAEWIYYQIGDYTNDTSWAKCTQNAEVVYRDNYVLPSNGGVPGYWNFAHGLAQDYLRTGDQTSRQAVVLLSQNAAYAVDGTNLSWTSSALLSREVAYAIMSYLDAEAAGERRRARLTDMVNQAYGHLDQWFVSSSAPYIKPFMVGLTAQALISYHERTGDARLLPALTNALDKMWNTLWVPSARAFLYISKNVSGEGAAEPAPDLNLLIAPAYAWLYHQTGEKRFQERGDQIFLGGLENAWLNGAKQFNQNYRWSFDYVAWRSSSPLK